MNSEKYRSKYRIASARAQWWDYNQNGAYFITICSHERDHLFGEIHNGIMQLTHTGVIADIFWHEIPIHHQMVELGEFVVMPNHVHGILIINSSDSPVETGHALSLQSQFPENPIGKQRFQNPGKNSVSSIIGSYKSAVTKHANRLGLKHGWQSRFHDHIIRNQVEHQQIASYISANVANWENDRFFKGT